MIIHPEELTYRQIDLIAGAGVNVLGIHPVGGKDASISLSNLVKSFRDVSFRDKIDYAHQRGLEIEYEAHAAGYLMPRDLFDKHPEYFRKNAIGERTDDWNFCISNNDALSLFSKNAAELATSLYGSSNVFYFWLDDGWDTYCHCEKCSAFTPSEQQLIATNAMLEEIKKKIPNAKLSYLAYCGSMTPPKKVKPVKDIFLEYAPFAKYTAKGDDAKEKIRAELDMLQPLVDLFGKDDSKILEYWYDNSLFSGWKKPPKEFIPDEEAMKKDIEFFYGFGFEKISTFACFLGEDYVKLYGEPDFEKFGDCFKDK